MQRGNQAEHLLQHATEQQRKKLSAFASMIFDEKKVALTPYSLNKLRDERSFIRSLSNDEVTGRQLKNHIDIVRLIIRICTKVKHAKGGLGVKGRMGQAAGGKKKQRRKQRVVQRATLPIVSRRGTDPDERSESDTFLTASSASEDDDTNGERSTSYKQKGTKKKKKTPTTPSITTTTVAS